MGAFHKLAYNPSVRGIVRGLHLSKAARAVYHYVRGNRPIRLSAAGVSALFPCHDPRVRRRLEPTNLEEGHYLAALLSELRADDIFFDIGAEFGIYGVLAARKCKQVVCIEPIPRAARQIEETKRFSGLDNLSVYQFAIADFDGSVTMSEDTAGVEHNPRIDPQGNVTVEVLTLETFVQRFSLPCPNVVKIDVEGFEKQVSYGMRSLLPHVRLMLVEIHPQHSSEAMARGVIEFLKASGFQVEELPKRPPEIHVLCSRHGPQRLVTK